MRSAPRIPAAPPAPYTPTYASAQRGAAPPDTLMTDPSIFSSPLGLASAAGNAPGIATPGGLFAATSRAFRTLIGGNS